MSGTELKKEGNQQSKQNSAQIILLSAGVGIARGIVGFPIEQPLESIKTQWQARPALKNEY